MGGKGLGCGERGLSKGEVWVVGGANAQDPQGWKRPWGLWGVGLRLKERGPGVAPTPGVRGQGTYLGAQQASWAGAGQAITLYSSCRTPPACLS